MAKHAATEQKLGALHSMLATVFTKTLDAYSKRLEAVDKIDISDMDELEADLVVALMDKGVEPNPAMLSAISKFLKDNEIMFDTEELHTLSTQEKRLQDMRKNRDNVVSLDKLAKVS
jgi:tetrahydromethanopterin S-methyltransferase subunit A